MVFNSSKKAPPSIHIQTSAAPTFVSRSSAKTSALSPPDSPSSQDPPSPLTPPSLTLNGYPISAPSSSAFPPRRPHRSRRSMSSGNLRNRKTGSGVADTDTLTLKPSGQTGGQRRSPKSHRSGAVPNPLSKPIDFVRWAYWRISLWVAGTFSLGMLNEREGLGVMLVFVFLFAITVYSLFFTFPKHIQIVMRRASYYLFGGSRDSVMHGAGASSLESVLSQHSQSAAAAVSSVHAEYFQ